MNEFKEPDFKNVKFDLKSFKDGNISWQTRFLLRFWPTRGLSRLAKELGLNSQLMEESQNLFSKVSRIDIIPDNSGERGFQIILDKLTALYFYQEGDHFIFDGSEAGEYENGDVTIFDRLR